MFAVSLALVAQEFKPGRDRGVAMGVYGATIGVAVAFGPLVGGALVEGIGWESIFFLNVPIGIAALVITYTQAARVARPERVADRLGRPRHVLDRAVPARVRAAARQRRGLGLDPDRLAAGRRRACCWPRSSRSRPRVKEPMLPLHLFRKPAFTGVQLAAAGVSASMFALFLYLTFYLQGFLGDEPLEAGPALPAADRDELLRRGRDRSALISKVQARYLLAARPRLVTGLAPAPDGRPRRQPTSGPRCCAGFILAGAGVGPDQPGDRRRGGLGRAQGAERHGLRDQRHVPAGRHRDRHRRLGSDLPRARRRQGRAAAGGHARAPPATGPASWSRRCPRATSTPPWRTSPPGSRAAVADAAREGFLAGHERDPHARRDPGHRRRGGRPVAGPRARHRARRGRSRPSASQGETRCRSPSRLRPTPDHAARGAGPARGRLRPPWPAPSLWAQGD